MNLYKLKYFIITAEEMNISKAAERLYISQQALSSQISQLEQYYGVKLFNRKPSLSLTHAGTVLLEKARMIIDLENEVEAEMDSINHHRRGSLKIGISYARGKLFASKIIPRYHKQNPGVDLTLVEGNSAELCDFLEHQNVDLIIDFAPIMLRDITTISLIKEHIFMIVPDELKDDYTDPTDLKKCLKGPLLLLPKKNFLRNMLDQYFNSHNIVPDIVIESKNIDTLYSLCQQNMGITFCTEMYARHLEDTSGVSVIPLDEDVICGELVLAHLNANIPSPIVKGFIRSVLDFLEEMY